MASPVALRAQAASLRRDYPGWHFIVSNRGRFWAWRHIFKRLDSGHVIWDYNQAVDGDSALEIREKIAAKEGR